MIPNEIIVATSNQDKLREVREIFTDCKILSPKDLGIDFDAEETGDTFEQNAAIKARALYNIVHKTVISDDSGLCVDALGGAPGVFSARYSGGDSKDNLNKLLSEMRLVKNRNAKYVCAICYIDEVIGEIIVRGECEGKIFDCEVGNGGFGYDPIFYSNALNKSFGLATKEEKNAVSHRGIALKKLHSILSK